MVVVEVGEKRTAQCPLRDRPGVQRRPDSREARPHQRIMAGIISPPQVMVHPVCLA